MNSGGKTKSVATPAIIIDNKKNPKQKSDMQ